MKYFHSAFFLLLATGFISCKTYSISTESLQQQFAGIDSSKFIDVSVKGPVGETYRYKANPIKVIKCTDKNNRSFELVNSPSIEMRVTHKNKKTIFYFDRVFVSDSTIKGVQSRFISSLTKTILLKDIKKIEIQDGRKNYHYQ
jgi:hypothetical protein